MPPTAQFGQSFNPSAVMMGRSSGGPYLWTGSGKTPPAKGGPIMANPQPAPGPMPGPMPVGAPPAAPPMSGAPAQATAPAPPAAPSNVIGPESIRATGSGPFDPAYRQNLATYAGGQFSRPGGSMNFNPTDPSTFPGQPVGGGNAPVAGMPTSLIDQALSGQSFSWTPPADTATATPGAPGNAPAQTLQAWMNQFLQQGGRMGAIA